MKNRSISASGMGDGCQRRWIQHAVHFSRMIRVRTVSRHATTKWGLWDHTVIPHPTRVQTAAMGDRERHNRDALFGECGATSSVTTVPAHSTAPRDSHSVSFHDIRTRVHTHIYTHMWMRTCIILALTHNFICPCISRCALTHINRKTHAQENTLTNTHIEGNFLFFLFAYDPHEVSISRQQ